MLIRVIYVSNAVGPQTSTMTNSILKSAQAWNRANDITGVLCQGQGVFLQVLEGERSVVTKLYSRIFADQRGDPESRRLTYWFFALAWSSRVAQMTCNPKGPLTLNPKTHQLW